MKVLAFFTDNGAPKTGLTPLIDIVRLDTGALVVNGANMTALANMPHAYEYDFMAYNNKLEYAVFIDGDDVTLSNIDRYKYAGSEGADIEFIKDMRGGRRWIDEDNNQEVFYKPDGLTEIARFNLLNDSQPATNNIDERQRV